MNLHHHGIRVRDLEPSIAWYRNVLGYEVERRFQIPDADLDIVMLKAEDGSRLELLGTMSPGAKHEQVGQMHVCFAVADIHAEADRLRSLNAAFIQEPKEIPEAGVRNFWITDGEGNLVEYIQPL